VGIIDIILIPGFWLQASAWGAAIPALEAAGHTVHALTLPGKESAAADRSGIGLRDHVDAVVAAIDEIGGPVVLVGHSGGGAIAHGAADARVEQVKRVVYVDSFPLGDGGAVNPDLPVVNGEVPLPDWSVFEDDDLIDLTDELRERFRGIAVPEPLGVTSDKQVLGDDRRYDIPATIIACEFTPEQMQKWMAAGEGMLAELSKVKDVAYISLPTGHWPMFTRPVELGAALVKAVS
jgi:pimeloyl-ACP methyl ester carboxylesterase